MAQVSVRVDDEVKRNAEATLNAIGIPMSTAVNVFLKAVAREHRIPFELNADPFYSDSNMRQRGNGFDGIGKPEPLRGNLSGFWSRRIDDANRLVYRVKDGVLEIVSCKGHYDD